MREPVQTRDSVKCLFPPSKSKKKYITRSFNDILAPHATYKGCVVHGALGSDSKRSLVGRYLHNHGQSYTLSKSAPISLDVVPGKSPTFSSNWACANPISFLELYSIRRTVVTNCAINFPLFPGRLDSTKPSKRKCFFEFPRPCGFGQ